MTQSSILINFGVDIIIEIVNLEVLKKLKHFIPYKTLLEKNPIKTMIWGQKFVFGHFSSIFSKIVWFVLYAHIFRYYWLLSD